MKQILAAFLCAVSLTSFANLQVNDGVSGDNTKIHTRPVSMFADGDIIVVYADENTQQIEISLLCLSLNTDAKEIYLQRDKAIILVNVLNSDNQSVTLDITGLSKGKYDICVKSSTEVFLMGVIEKQ